MGYNEGVSWILPTLECSAPAETGERWLKDGLAEFRVAWAGVQALLEAGWTQGRPFLPPLTRLQRPQVGCITMAGQDHPQSPPTPPQQPLWLSLPRRWPPPRAPSFALKVVCFFALKNSPRERNTQWWLSAEIPDRFTLDQGPGRGVDPAWVTRKQVKGLGPDSGSGSLLPWDAGCEGGLASQGAPRYPVSDTQVVRGRAGLRDHRIYFIDGRKGSRRKEEAPDCTTSWRWQNTTLVLS